MERLTAPMWLGLAAIAVLGSVGGTLWAVGAADVALVGLAVIGGASGVGAAVRRRALDVLPLELAPVVAIRDEGAGPRIAVRAWLGRGRRVDALSVDVAFEGAEDAPLQVFVPPTPLVGRFQIGITGLPEDHDGRSLRVVLRAGAAGQDQVASRTYGVDDRRHGRFAPGLSLERGLRWAREEWAHVEGQPEAEDGNRPEERESA